jgi:hypothetical protein
MALTTRMLPANAVGGAVVGFAGAGSQDPSRRSYSASAGQFIDASGPPDADASVLASQGFIPICASGTTVQRNQLSPGGYFRPGTLYLDTVLAKIVCWDGLNWRDPVTAAVV